MLNKIAAFVKERNLTGSTVIAAVSGGADSVALLFALHLLQDKLGIHLEAAHFNHHLRGEESRRDEQFVRELCDRYDVPLHFAEAEVKAGKKGLEAAARDARYAFLRTLPGVIATAHTADDNAETVLMHLVRGTGLKGLGGIAPVSGSVIRPMLNVTRAEVLAFLEEYWLPHVEDSSNASRDFLRNRIRHGIMPLLREENPRIAENLSRMALRLREDEACLAAMTESAGVLTVAQLQALLPALRSRSLEKFLKESGVREPEDSHIAMAQALLDSDKPSARACFPGNITIGRQYDRLAVLPEGVQPEDRVLTCPGSLEIPELGIRVVCRRAEQTEKKIARFTVCPEGEILVTCRRAGDAMTLGGGTKSLKKLFIDRKIPASQRPFVPVLRDDRGILGAWSIGADITRLAEALPAAVIYFEEI